MRRGTIIKNLWAGYETYFCFQGVSKDMAHGYDIVNVDDKWKVRRGTFYWRDIRDDREHFPIVGFADINKAIISAMLNGMEGSEGETIQS